MRATHDPWLLSPLLWLFAAVSALAWVTSPFNGELGRFKPETHALLKGQTVQGPCNFNGYFERREFIIPGAKIVAHFAAQPVGYADVEGLLETDCVPRNTWSNGWRLEPSQINFSAK